MTPLRIILPSGLEGRIDRAAQRRGLSRSEWILTVIQRALEEDDPIGGDALERLAALEAPVGDIGEMVAGIEAGRGR